MFIAKLGRNDEANAAFGQAVQMDLNMPKAWSEWGRYNDHMFKEDPMDTVVASSAVRCYLQDADPYKNSKTRPLLIRILWFLSLDKPITTISKALNFKGDIALWYWITLIPKLLKALSHRAAPQCWHAHCLLMISRGLTLGGSYCVRKCSSILIVVSSSTLNNITITNICPTVNIEVDAEHHVHERDKNNMVLNT